MKKFLSIFLVTIVSIGVLAGSLIGIQSKGFKYWDWTSKLEKFKFWEKDKKHVSKVDKDTDVFNKIVNTPVVANGFDYNLGKSPVINLDRTAWTCEQDALGQHFLYDNYDNFTTDVSEHQYELEKAKLTIGSSDTALTVSADFLVTGKRSSELWGKYGIEFINENGFGFFFFVNASGSEGVAVDCITGNKLCIVKVVNYLYDWENIFTPVSEFEGVDVNIIDVAKNNNLKVVRSGSDFTCYLNNIAIYSFKYTGISEIEKISPRIVSMNIDLDITNLYAYKTLNVELEGQILEFDKTISKWVYNLEKGKRYTVKGLEDNVTYYSTQSVNGQAPKVYMNKVEELIPNKNIETAEIADLTLEVFGENTFNYLANVSSFYGKTMYDEVDNIFTIDGDFKDGKGCFWQNDKNEIFYVWRAPVEADTTEAVANDYFTFTLNDGDGNVGSFNFRYTI